MHNRRRSSCQIQTKQVLLVKPFSQAEEEVAGSTHNHFGKRELKTDLRRGRKSCTESDAAEDPAAAVEETATAVKGREGDSGTKSNLHPELMGLENHSQLPYIIKKGVIGHAERIRCGYGRSGLLERTECLLPSQIWEER